MFDNQQGTVANSLQLIQVNPNNLYGNQINQISCHSNMSLLGIAHENGTLNFVDYNSNKIVKTLTDAHSDSVSCIKFAGQNGGLSVITGSHDGTIKIWDLRNHKCIAQVSKAHGRKYDEGVMCIDSHSSTPFFASGGADCVVNIYELNLN